MVCGSAGNHDILSISLQVGTDLVYSFLMETKTCHEECPITRVLDLLSGRWALPVLFHLIQAEGPIRFGQLQRSIGRVTQKELTRTLREFESRGLVERRVFAEVPPRVEYTVTRLGETLRTPLQALAKWSEEHASSMKSAEVSDDRVPSSGILSPSH